MCIACELGYLSIIDALEAERNALREREKAAQFICEPVPEFGAEPDVREQPPQSAGESTP